MLQSAAKLQKLIAINHQFYVRAEKTYGAQQKYWFEFQFEALVV